MKEPKKWWWSLDRIGSGIGIFIVVASLIALLSGLISLQDFIDKWWFLIPLVLIILFRFLSNIDEIDEVVETANQEGDQI
jgi:hypothetical protein